MSMRYSTTRLWTALACTIPCALALSALPAQAQQTVRKPALKAQTPVTLNFVNADIEAVSRAIGAMLGRQILVDPRVKGVITLYSEQALPVNEAYLSYLAALRGLGFTVVDSAGLLKVVPESDAKLQSSTVEVGAGGKQRGDQILTQIYKLNHENANNLVAILRPLITPNNTINANPGNNSLVITDYADNLQRISRIVAAMDTPASTDIEVVPLKHALASDIAALVQRLGDGGSAAAAVPGQTGGSLSVLADPRSNALILRAANPVRLASMRAMIEKLDQPLGSSASASNIRVVHLKNADATKLATVLRAAFGSGGGGSSSSASGSSSSTGLGGSSSAATGLGSSVGGSASSGTASAAATTPVAASASPSTGGFVQADPSTNSLIITAAEPLYRQVRSVIDQLDGRRAQVYVESMIVKVDASKAAQFGVQWQSVFGSKGDKTISGLGTNFGTGTANIVNLSGATANGIDGITSAISSGVSAGMNIGVLKKIGDYYTLGALANLLQSDSGTNVLSTPNLIALDNEEAKIVIGQNVPFVTGSYTTSNSSSSNPFQTIERKDVGLTLRIKSQIGEGGTVRMTIYQENSSVVSATASSTTGPTTDKSSIETTVVADNGQIVVLGGLLKDEYADGEDRVPGLASIPVLGHLFKAENRKRIKTNLMVFLRPVVLRDQPSADQVTLDRYEMIRAAQQGTQPKSSIVLPDTGAPLLPATPTAPTPAASQPATQPAKAN